MKNNIEAALNELSQFKIFETYSREEILSLCENSDIKFTQHREAIFQFNNDAEFFGIVLSGAYKLSKTSARGDDVILHFSTPGDVVAALIMGQKTPIYPVSAISMGPSRFLKIPRENYVTRWMQKPELILRIQSQLSNRMSALQEQKSLIKSPLSQRIAALLLSLFETKHSDTSLDLPLPITRKEIADSLGASPESVIRIMSDWSKHGLIETNDMQIKILRLNSILEIYKG